MTKVEDIKTIGGQLYCLVDGGIHQVNYYGQMLGMKKPRILAWPHREEAAREWTVCGSLCTSGDVLAKGYPLAGIRPGDKLVFEKAGAYSVTEGIALFLSRDLPRVVLYSEESGFRPVRGRVETDAWNSASDGT